MRADLDLTGAAERVAAERAAQGLPPKVTDPLAYRDLSVLLRQPSSPSQSSDTGGVRRPGATRVSPSGLAGVPGQAA